MFHTHTFGLCPRNGPLLGKLHGLITLTASGRRIGTQPKSLFAVSEGPWAFCSPGSLFAGRLEAPLVITNGAQHPPLVILKGAKRLPCHSERSEAK